MKFATLIKCRVKNRRGRDLRCLALRSSAGCTFGNRESNVAAPVVCIYNEQHNTVHKLSGLHLFLTHLRKEVGPGLWDCDAARERGACIFETREEISISGVLE